MSPLLITSAAYVGADIAAEVGMLPPAFLPVGGRRLYELQLREFAVSAQRVILTLPADFEPDPADARLLSRARVEIVRLGLGMSLGESVLAALRSAGLTQGPLAILHGDTLCLGLDLSTQDAVSVGETDDHYRWARFEVAERGIQRIADDDFSHAGSRQVLSGWFHLGDAATLIRSIERAGGFVSGLDDYTRQRPLQPLSSGEWLDFGHVNTFYQSRGRFSTERSFNALAVSRRIVRKRSHDRTKIAAEIGWYQNLPSAIRPYAATLVDAELEADPPGYSLEHLYLTPLSDLFVFGRLPRLSWRRIFRACDEFIFACRTLPAPRADVAKASAILLEKSERRLAEFATATSFDITRPISINGTRTPSLTEIVAQVAAAIRPATPEHVSFAHGDMSFANLLYDFRAQMIRVVDPRGLNGRGEPSVFGDIRYDIAKLWQCALGGYDFLLAGRYQLEITDSHQLELVLPFDDRIADIQEFRASRFGGLSPDDADASLIAILLFISMLPLHGDDPQRQMALLANAVRLFAQEWVGP